MAVSVYTDPGSYTEEVVNQGGITLGQVRLAATLFGAASPFRTFSNEVVIRGQTIQTLVVDATPGAHTAPLTVASDSSLSNTQIRRDGVLLPKTAFSFNNASQVLIADSYYKAASTYIITYLAPSSLEDDLANANVNDIIRIGSFSGVTSFALGTDYDQDGDKVDWSILTAAVLTGIPATPFDLSVNKNIAFSLDGKPTLTVDCQGATPNATTATEVVTKLNAALSASGDYGAAYATAASVSTTHVRLTSQVPGKTGSVKLQQAGTLSAHLEVFGVATLALPLTVTGVGMKPALGSAYYVTYRIERPETDYNVPFQFFTPAAAFEVLGYPDIDNHLANYADICFANGAPSVYCVIAKPENDGSYSDAGYIAALAATESKQGMTEIIPAAITSLNVQIAAYQSVINMSSLLQRKRRRLWVGMARGTAIGDIETPNSLIWLAGVTLQVPGDSPGRGRMIVTAPSECTRIITLVDNTKVPVEFDGTALAAASAAVQTSFISASTSLLGKTLAGFDSITDLGDAERKLLASSGINVVSLVGGKLELKDPITTEVAGGGLNEFNEISVGVQKDKVAKLVDDAIEANLKGIVPEDLTDFISDIKEVVQVQLKALVDAGDIGKYTNPATGAVRDIDMQTDIQAFQSATDKTQFGFRYWFNGKYPAKRFFGQFSVDNPFFISTQGG